MKGSPNIPNTQQQQNGDEQSHWQAAWCHEGMKEQDVDRDCAQHDQSKGHKTIDEQQKATERLQRHDDDKLMRDEETAHEHASRPGRRWSRNEVQKAIHSKYEINQTEKIASDGGREFNSREAFLYRH